MNSSDLPAPLAFAGGEVHNRVDPFASALIVEGDRIAWLGSDEAVEVVGGTPPSDLAGQLVAPPFADAWVEDLDDGVDVRLMERGVRAALAVHASQGEAGGAPDPQGCPLLFVRARPDRASRPGDS